MMKWKSLALDEPPIMGDCYSAPVLVRIAPKEYFFVRFFRYENGLAIWETTDEDEYEIPASADDFWISIDELEKEFER